MYGTQRTGIHLVLSNGADDTNRQRWEHSLLHAGPLYAVARFRLIDGHRIRHRGSFRLVAEHAGAQVASDTA
jgi:hypothetical protein